MNLIKVIDSHTGGEPTRVVIDGGPDIGSGSAADLRERFKNDHDSFRCAVVNEPRGSDILVGGLLVEPKDQTCEAGVIFFNNVGMLNMCGHGLIGFVATLSHLGRIQPGKHSIETSVGLVSTQLHDDGQVSFENVPSYRKAKSIKLEVEGYGEVTGDVAWGGNWFFLIKDHNLEIDFENVDELTQFTWNVRKAVNANGYQEVDHIEMFAAPENPENNSRNFVLCPGKAYDRSPCGTGTSAKVACMAEDGLLQRGEVWRQESITGSVFEGSYRVEDGKVIPSIKGSAFVNGESTLILNPADPLCWGIDSQVNM